MNSEVSSFVIPNGLTVIHIPRLNSLNVSISLRVLAGSMYESSEEVGIAHFLEHIVSDGTEKYPNEKELANLIEAKGGYKNAFTNKETIEYVVRVLKEDSEVAIECLSEIISRPLIREEDVQKQKNIIEQEIYRFQADPEKLAVKMISSVVFPGTRVGGLITGEVVDIKKISRESILSYLKRTHCAKNMVLAICGNLSKDQVQQLALRYFGDMKSGEKIPAIEVKVHSQNQPKIEVKHGLKQAILSLGYQGFTSNNPDRYAVDLVLQVLSRGKSSRLVYEIREKRALAYVVSGGNFHGRNFGMFTIRVGLAGENIHDCLEIIKTELKNIISVPLSKYDLERSLALIKSGMAFSFEDSLAEASYHSSAWCSTGEIRSINQEFAKYESVARNPDLIMESAKKIFFANPAIFILDSEARDGISD